MATIGKALASPEVGWNRYNNNNSIFLYEGDWQYVPGAGSFFNQDFHVARKVGDKVKFNFTGTSLRIMSDQYSNRAVVRVYIDGVDCGTYSLDGDNRGQILLYEKNDLNGDKEHFCYLEKISGSDFLFDSIDIIGTLKSYQTIVYYKKNVLIFNNKQYKKYLSSSWQTVTSIAPTELDYLNGNTLEEVASIPEAAWKELQGEIKVSYYTNDESISEITIETEVCPYTIYDEFGDTMEVLYYTDDATKDKASLEITANYSPLDEFYDQPMSLVTYTNDASPVSLAVEGIAPSQWIYQSNDIDIRQGLEGVKLYGSASGKGISRVLVSPDKGVSWFTIKGEAFTQVNPLGNLNRCDLATYDAYNALDASVWKAFFLNKETLRVAYFLSEFNTEDTAIADKIEIQLAAVSIDTPTIESIQFEISELTLEGRLKDLELINAINMQKLQFKTNALMKSKKYKMHDLVVDTFEEDSMVAVESPTIDITEIPFTSPVEMEYGFYSEVSLSGHKYIKKAEVFII